jgi:hypothetical protein
MRGDTSRSPKIKSKQAQKIRKSQDARKSSRCTRAEFPAPSRMHQWPAYPLFFPLPSAFAFVVQHQLRLSKLKIVVTTFFSPTHPAFLKGR